LSWTSRAATRSHATKAANSGADGQTKKQWKQQQRRLQQKQRSQADARPLQAQPYKAGKLATFKGRVVLGN